MLRVLILVVAVVVGAVAPDDVAHTCPEMETVPAAHTSPSPDLSAPDAAESVGRPSSSCVVAATARPAAARGELSSPPPTRPPIARA